MVTIGVKLSFISLRNPIFDWETNDSGLLLCTTTCISVLVDDVGSELNVCNSIADTSIELEMFFDPVHLMK